MMDFSYNFYAIPSEPQSVHCTEHEVKVNFSKTRCLLNAISHRIIINIKEQFYAKI